MLVISFFPTPALASSASSESVIAAVVSSEAPLPPGAARTPELPPEAPCSVLDDCAPQAAPASARTDTRTIAATFAPRGFVPGFLTGSSMLKIAPFLSGCGNRIYGPETTADLARLAVSAAINPRTGSQPRDDPRRDLDATPQRSGGRSAGEPGREETGAQGVTSSCRVRHAPRLCRQRVRVRCPRTGRPPRRASGRRRVVIEKPLRDAVWDPPSLPSNAPSSRLGKHRSAPWVHSRKALRADDLRAAGRKRDPRRRSSLPRAPGAAPRSAVSLRLPPENV